MFDNLARTGRGGRGAGWRTVAVSAALHSALIAAIALGSPSRSSPSQQGSLLRAAAGDPTPQEVRWSGALATSPRDPPGGAVANPARVAWEGADTLRLGERALVRVRLLLPRAAPDSVPRVWHARLAGAGMISEYESPALQLSDSLAVLGWEWGVTPREMGLRSLELVLEAASQEGGEIRIRTAATLRRDVVVEATAWQRISRFVAFHWTWLAPLALIPAVLLALQRRRH